MSFEERNREALLAAHEELARLLTGAVSEEGSVTLADTPSGAPTAMLRGRFVHSQHDPRMEAERQVAREVQDTHSAVIVLGFGLGYVAEAVRLRFPEMPVLVLEPEPAMFLAALEARDLSHLLSDERIWFHVASKPEEVASLLPALPLAKPVFLKLRPAIECNPGWFRIAEEITRSWALRSEINLNTLNRFGRLWIRNLAQNVRSFVEAPGIARLAGLCTGLPALVIAGGPSLDDVLPWLPRLRERLVIISVNTPLKSCVDAGAVPDFVVVVDPQYWASRFLDWIPLPELGQKASGPIVIAEPSTHPRVLRSAGAAGWAAARYLCSSLFPLGETLEAALGEKGKLGAGGSVATAAWDLARHLGAAPVYTAGLDLGYPGMRTHCKGVFTEELWLSASGRLQPLETSSFRSLRDIGLFTVPSASGGLAPTDRRMLLYKWWFESQIALHPEAPTFTLSPNGAAIPGMQVSRASDLMSLPKVRQEIDRRIDEELRAVARRGPPGHDEPVLRKLLDELLTALDELQQLGEKALAANNVLESSLKEAKAAASALSELDGIDSRILAISQRGIAGFLMQSLIHRISDKGERKASPEETISDGAALYRGIKESALWQKELIGKALSRLSQT